MSTCHGDGDTFSRGISRWVWVRKDMEYEWHILSRSGGKRIKVDTYNLQSGIDHGPLEGKDNVSGTRFPTLKSPRGAFSTVRRGGQIWPSDLVVTETGRWHRQNRGKKQYRPWSGRGKTQWPPEPVSRSSNHLGGADVVVRFVVVRFVCLL